MQRSRRQLKLFHLFVQWELPSTDHESLKKKRLDLLNNAVYHNMVIKLNIADNLLLFTIAIASRVTMARISAQETTPGHFFSISALTASMTWYPLIPKLGTSSFSALFYFVEFSSTEPSHPCKHAYIAC